MNKLDNRLTYFYELWILGGSMKKKFKQILIMMLVCGLVMTSLIKPSYAEGEPNIVGESAVLIDMDSGKVLWGKNETLERPLASTTKILTGLIAIEKGKLNDEVLIGKNPTLEEGTRVYLIEGEKETLENLLYGMLLNSANDAAYAIAEHVGGSVEGFAKLMNERALKIGAKNSHFVNPNGLTAAGHYTTAKDLALIAREAMKNPTFRKIVGTKNRPWKGASWQSTLLNQNKLLTEYPGTIGVKTGYTKAAQMCLVNATERNGTRLLSVVLGSPGRNIWTDTKAILDYGFKNYKTQTIANKGEVVLKQTIEKQQLVAVLANDFSILQKNGSGTLPEGKAIIKELILPIHKGDIIGQKEFYLDHKKIGTINIISTVEIKHKFNLSDFWNIFATVMTILFFLLIILKQILNCKKRRRMFY
jgi:D-alanyl-D-alanine carboxypeptidase (penicillin-binding protein 5/6)